MKISLRRKFQFINSTNQTIRLFCIPECIAPLGAANIDFVRGRTAILASISVRRWSLVVGIEHQSTWRVVFTWQNGFVGLLQEGELTIHSVFMFDVTAQRQQKQKTINPGRKLLRFILDLHLCYRWNFSHNSTSNNEHTIELLSASRQINRES